MEHSLPFDKGQRFYNRRLVEALEQSDYNRAWAIVETLHRRHPEEVVLWPYTYNLMLRHYCKKQKTLKNTNLTRMLVLLDVMVAQGCADQTSFQVVMAACSRARHLPSARHVLDKMKEAGNQPDERIYGFLINCCARKRGFVETAERYLEEMLTATMKPTVLVINALLRVYSRDRGRSKMLLELVSRAYHTFGVLPDVVTTRIVVHYLLREGNVVSAVNYLREIERSLPLDSSAKFPIRRQEVNALTDACRQRGEWDSAEYVLTLAKRIDEGDILTTNTEKQVLNTEDLENLVARRDVSSVAVAWDVCTHNWSCMSRSKYKAYILKRIENESFERALEKIHLRSVSSKVDQSIERLSLKLEGKFQVLDEVIGTRNASAADFNVILVDCGRQGRLTDAISVFTKMKEYAKTSPECTPSIRSYNALLNAYALRGDVHKMEFIVNEMVKNGVQIDRVTMNTIIKAHITRLKSGVLGSKARLNSIMKALSFFQWCANDQKKKIDSGVTTYYLLFRMFATYVEMSSNDSDRTFHTNRISSCNDKHNEEPTEEIDEELVAWMGEFISTTCRDAPLTSLDISVFNNAFNYYYRLSDVDESFALFNLLTKRGYQPNDTTLGLIFATCASQQQFELGLRFLDHLMTTDGYKPTLKVLSGAMQLSANSKNPDRALELFRAIEKSGTFSPAVETYEPLVFAYARVGNLARACEVADELKERLGTVPVSIYNRILLACVEAALPGRALEILKVVRLKTGVVPDIVSYNTVLEAFWRAGERAAWWRNNRSPRESEDFFEDMDEDDGERCDVKESLENEEDIACKDPTRADSIGMMLMPSPNDELKEREKSAWVRASILDLLDEMHRGQVEPDKITYERAIAACSVNGDSKGVVLIFDRLVDRTQGKVKLKSDLMTESTFFAYLAECTSLQDKDRVIEAPTLLHRWHVATCQVPPAFVVTQMLESLESLSEWRRALQLLPEWQTMFGSPPSVAVFNQVMQICNRAGQYQLVAPIFATMQNITTYRVIPDSESYIQHIYAEEQRENWVTATNLFVEMQKRYPSDEISLYQLQKIALGRYRLRQSEH
ncbi:hypothetical protein PsorP6_008498 [Peronosclerospora sorghi]|uniref:Uncharacterized protein n=1 Tax=Peronosclerospora sorghi TaxID=230839 RepID=A0ACC0W8F3_9STRA|nr:hypothetical protein PsorP6_008498 [Peronosclerospora sorghi]